MAAARMRSQEYVRKNGDKEILPLPSLLPLESCGARAARVVSTMRTNLPRRHRLSLGAATRVRRRGALFPSRQPGACEDESRLQSLLCARWPLDKGDVLPAARLFVAVVTGDRGQRTRPSSEAQFSFFCASARSRGWTEGRSKQDGNGDGEKERGGKEGRRGGERGERDFLYI